jgi:hypothetical protein
LDLRERGDPIEGKDAIGRDRGHSGSGMTRASAVAGLHAWAAWRVDEIEKKRRGVDRTFLEG